MIERDKQVDEQQKKHQAEKEHQHPQKDSKAQQQQQAGMSTDKAAMKDEGYIARIDEKTSKH